MDNVPRREMMWGAGERERVRESGESTLEATDGGTVDGGGIGRSRKRLRQVVWVY